MFLKFLNFLGHLPQTPPAKEDTQLRPEDAVINILLNRPDLNSTLSSVTNTSQNTEMLTSEKTVLKKPSAIGNAEKVEAAPQVFGQISTGSIQTSLIGVPNPFVSTSSSGTMSYNKLAIAAVLSIVPTMVIAFPFLAPSLGKRRRRK